MYSSAGTRECSGPPKMLFHQYHPSTFKAATLTDDVFAVPKVSRGEGSQELYGDCVCECVFERVTLLSTTVVSHRVVSASTAWQVCETTWKGGKKCFVEPQQFCGR